MNFSRQMELYDAENENDSASVIGVRGNRLMGSLNAFKTWS